jgi:hypothetical protein
MAGIKEMRDELLGLLYEQLGFLNRSNHLTMPASPGFPDFLFYLGFSPLRWRVAGLTLPGLPCSLEFVGRTPHESLLEAARFLPSVDVAEQRRLRLSSGRESGCGPVDQLDLEGRRFVDEQCLKSVDRLGMGRTFPGDR